MKSSRKIVTLIFIAVALGVALWWGDETPTPPTRKADYEAQCLRVHDGDTLTVRGPHGEERIRVWGIDAPEKGQDYGDRSRSFARNLAQGKAVTVRPVERDRFGRLVARVELAGEDYGSILIGQGWAWHFRRFSQDKKYQRLEDEARQNSLGLWAGENPVPLGLATGAPSREEAVMNVLLVEDEDFVGEDLVRITGRRQVHLRKVLRVTEGQKLRVGLLGGKMGFGVVESLQEGESEIRVHLDQDPPDPLPVELILALPRPKVFRRVLRQITTLGIKRIWLIGAWRVEKSYWSSPLLSSEEMNRQIRLGLEQAVDTVPPEISLHPRFKTFVEDELPPFLEGKMRWLADPIGQEIPVFKAPANKALLAIGPEGGWNDFERGLLLGQGFRSFSVGPRVLKVEEAVPFLVSRLANPV